MNLNIKKHSLRSKVVGGEKNFYKNLKKEFNRTQLWILQNKSHFDYSAEGGHPSTSAE